MKLTLASCIAAVGMLAITFLPSTSAGYEPARGALEPVLEFLLSGWKPKVAEEFKVISSPNTVQHTPEFDFIEHIENPEFIEICHQGHVEREMKQLKVGLRRKPLKEAMGDFLPFCARLLKINPQLYGEFIIKGMKVMARHPPPKIPGYNGGEIVDRFCNGILHPEMMNVIKGHKNSQKKTYAAINAFSHLVSNWRDENFGCAIGTIFSMSQ